ncbi:MAG: sigma-70 family RNA polymerase sigma factor [Isosphaerales bacterium]
MARVTSGSIVRQIESLFEGSSVAGLTDRQLLERFNARRDPAGEMAFAALVTRHGPMVLDICRQLLHDLHHAEDAFQAVFLVLARKSRSIREPDLLGNWLYGVALRTARKAKVRLARQRKNEEGDSMRRPGSGSIAAVEPMVPVAEQPTLAREEAEALHSEIARLPGPFRLPVVLCYFEGLTLDEAARRLHWPAGTVRSRLARARDKLRRGLTHRGVALPSAALTAALSPRPASAQISAYLCDATTRAAIHFAAGQAAAQAVSASATTLAQEVLRSMLLNKLKFTVLTLLTLGAVATGAGYLSHSMAMMNDEPQKAPAGRQQPAAKVDEPNRAAPGRMIVAGRVLDPAGKPLARVPVDIIGRPRVPWVATREDVEPRIMLGRGMTGPDGRFRLDATRTSADGFFEVDAMAAAPGSGLGWARLNPDAAQPEVDIRLKPEQIIRGKLIDVNAQPASGVELRIRSVGRPTNTGMYDGVSVGTSRPPQGLRVWPSPVTTDDQGRFTLAGIGRNLTVGFGVRDLRFARQGFQTQTDDRDGPKDVALALQPSTIVEGRALAADTGQPIAGALVEVASSQKESELQSGGRFRADDQGRFTANVQPGKYYRVQAFPPEGQPYLILRHEFEWTKGAVKKVVDVKLVRGVLIRGKVIERGTGRPLEGASVQYIASRNRGNLLDGWQGVVASRDDGSFQIVVSPGKGYLFVYGPTSGYILEAIGSRMLSYGQPGGERYYAHSIIPYEVKASDQPHEITASLRPGKTIKGRVIGPEGQTVEKAEIITTLHFNYFHLNWRGDLTVHVRDGSFELHGLDPERAARVSLLDADHQWGATVELSGKQADEELTIRLQPCGQAKARFVGPGGKPVANIFPHFEILGTPGPQEETRDPKDQAMLAADATYMPNLDRKHYWGGPFTDAAGRITLPDLIPGALYRISDPSNRPQQGVQVRKDFSVKPGETLDLGDILIEKPQS